jgi:hypothetical protein
MFLRCHPRIKDGKDHRYWNIVENRRCGRGKVVQRQVLYLGEINDNQRESWCRTIAVFDEQREQTLPLALFPADRQLPNFAADFGVQVGPWGAMEQWMQLRFIVRRIGITRRRF